MRKETGADKPADRQRINAASSEKVIGLGKARSMTSLIACQFTE
jgi:hypothetical protein